MDLAQNVTVTIANPGPPRVVVAPTAPAGSQLVVVPAVGPTGPAGPTAGVELMQATPASTWSFTHTLARRPAVAIYAAGQLVAADVVATATQVVITFPAPVSGSAVLT